MTYRGHYCKLFFAYLALNLNKSLEIKISSLERVDFLCNKAFSSFFIAHHTHGESIVTIVFYI